MKKIIKLNYEKANRLLQDKQCEILLRLPEDLRSAMAIVINAEYILTMLEEGHEPETYEHEYEILPIRDFEETDNWEGDENHFFCGKHNLDDDNSHSSNCTCPDCSSIS